MIGWILVGVGLLAAGAAIYFWDWVRTEISSWLRRNGYSQSKLMSAFIKLDRVVVGIRARARIYVKTWNSSTQTKVTEKEISFADLPEDVKRQLRSTGQATLSYSY